MVGQIKFVKVTVTAHLMEKMRAGHLVREMADPMEYGKADSMETTMADQKGIMTADQLGSEKDTLKADQKGL